MPEDVSFDLQHEDPVFSEPFRWGSASELGQDYWSGYSNDNEFDGDPSEWTAKPREDAALEFVDEAAGRYGIAVLPLVIELLRQAPNRDSPFFLGAGPISILLKEHGDESADALAVEAERSPRMRVALSGRAAWLTEEQMTPTLVGALGAWIMREDDTTPF